jgi:tetratricopeptide (TPR) repeat protein
MALLPWPRSPAPTDLGAKGLLQVDGIMAEVRVACCLGWSRIDFGYPIPYLDRAWARLPHEAASSDRVEIVEQRKRLLELVRDAERSLPLHREAVKRKPFDWNPRYWLAFALKRAGRNEEALEEYRAVARTPGCPLDCLNEIGWAYYRMERYKDARRCFERARIPDDLPIRPFSNFMLTLENKMLVYGQLGLRKQAEEAAWEYVRRYGRIEYPERRALAKVGIDVDAIYLKQHPFKA